MENWGFALNPFAFYTFTANQVWWVGLILAILEILFGLSLIFFGSKAMTAFLFTIASMMASLNIYIVFGGSQGEQSISTIALLIGLCFLASLLGVSLLVWVIPPVLMFFFGAYIGGFVGLALLSFGYTGMSLYGFLFTFSFAYVGGILSVMWDDVFWCIGTALFGSLMVADAIDRPAFHCGFWNIVANHAVYILSFNPALDLPVDERTNTFWIIFGVAALVALIGIAVQLAFTNRSETLARWIYIARVGATIPIYEIELREPQREEFHAKNLVGVYSSVNNIKLEEYEYQHG